MRINKDKPIGTVIFIVEGSSTEFNLLKRIFCYIFKFEYVEKTRKAPYCFQSKNSSHSRIYVINTKDSNISYIKNTDYLDKTYEYLINNYDLDLDNSAKFYIFDRDRESNTNIDMIKEFIKNLTDPYEEESGYGNGGMLILSYPSIESYIVSNFVDKSHNIKKRLGSEVKTLMGEEPYKKNIQFNKLSEDTLMFACNQFFEYITEKEIIYDIDDYKTLNESIFNIQEDDYGIYSAHRLVSLLSCAFLQLGLIEID